VTAEIKGNPAWIERARLDIEQECETWDWARTAGLSAEELRQAVLEASDRSGERRS
jgi:hypothetical protein